jgi:beta-1,4-mannosyltransferase
MQSFQNRSGLVELNSTMQSRSPIKVFTPLFNSSTNKYLDCLWSSVHLYGAEVDTLKLNLSFAKFKATYQSGDVIHLQWVDSLCKFDPNKRYQSWKLILSNLRRLIFLKSQGYKFVWTVHNSISHECTSPLIEKSFRWFLSRLCDDILVMSKYGQQEFARMYGRTKRVHIVPHGNYINSYPNQVSRTEARNKFGIGPDQKVLLYLGMIRRYKGIDNLITAFKHLKEPDVVLLIAGSPHTPDLVAEIEQVAKQDPRIHLQLEFIKDEDIQLYMNACDWVVLPYQKILNSGAVLLALSFGRPVIVPNLGSIAELICDGEHGYSYLADQDLENALRRSLTTSPEQWQQMCIQAYELAQKYNWSAIGEQIYQIYLQ